MLSNVNTNFVGDIFLFIEYIIYMQNIYKIAFDWTECPKQF